MSKKWVVDSSAAGRLDQRIALKKLSIRNFKKEPALVACWR